MRPPGLDGRSTKYYTADGRYLPGANDPKLLARKELLFAKLARVHEDLDALGEAHTKTGYGCLQSGKCCRVGLVLHSLELEHMARAVQKRIDEEPAYKPKIVKALERSLHDETWTFGEGTGDLWCAFYEDGCTAYPFRPSVCRMYGTILELNEECPRKRLATDREFIWIRPEADKVVRSLYDAVDHYGRVFPRADCSRYMASGLLMMLLPRAEVEKIRARTNPKFWKTLHGYRSQFVPSTRKPPYWEKHPAFPITLRLNAVTPVRL